MRRDVRSVLRAGYPLLKLRQGMPRHHHRAAWAILACRTPAMGGRVELCPNGHHDAVRFNSCRHRSCPRCAYRSVESWLDAKEKMLLGVDHFHVIFTVPSELRPLFEWNGRVLSDLLFEVVKATIFEFLEDPKHLGARPGILAALHTWSRTLVLHPHIHCLVSAGGVTPDGRWKPVKNGYLVPVEAVKVVYKGKLLDGIEKLLRGNRLRLPGGWNLGHAIGALRACARKKWNVRVEDRYEHGLGVATYLARYMRGGPIKSSRLVACDADGVVFRYGRSGSDRGRSRNATMRLPLEQFARRWFRHVPEKGQRVIRSWGLYHHSHRERLEACRAQCDEDPRKKRRKRRPALERRCPVCRCLPVDGPMVPPDWPQAPIPTSHSPPAIEVSP